MNILQSVIPKELLRLNSAATFFGHISKFICICTNASFQNVVKIYRPGCLVQYNEV